MRFVGGGVPLLRPYPSPYRIDSTKCSCPQTTNGTWRPPHRRTIRAIIEQKWKIIIDETITIMASQRSSNNNECRNDERKTTHDDEPPRGGVLVQQDGTVSLPFVGIVLGIVVAASGRWFYGLLLVTTGFVFAICNSAMDQLHEEDKQEIRYNIMEASDVVLELGEWEKAIKVHHDKRESSESNKNDEEEVVPKARIHFVAGLEALAKKYGNRKQQQQQQQTVMEQHRRNATERGTDKSFSPSSTRYHQFELLCQQAAYGAYRTFPDNDDQVVAAALSTHALVSKDSEVRQRHLFEADTYGLNLPVECMRASLQRAKEETNEDKEQQAAELQRKACLLLGALGDGNAEIATKIVEEDGLEAVLDTLNWYRYHEDVVNWALWAVFILSYENPSNKVKTVELGGVPIIVQALRNVPGCLEVARHGIAILFDLLREDSSSPSSQQLDIWTIRKSALAAGLHQAVLESMESHSSVIDIMMMGQEILSGTNFQGSAPQYQPNSKDVAG